MMICAEIGQNFVGDMRLAKQLIGYASDYGADLVKFQLYDSQKLYGEKQKSELTKEQAWMLFDYGKSFKMEVFFSVFDIERVAWCEEIGVGRYKLAYSQRENNDLISAIWGTNKPLFISSEKPTEYSTLYCISKYPALLEDLSFEKVDFNIFSGFSDHTIGLDAAKIAIARGAEFIEKHFSISHSIGVDGEWSMTPRELEELRKWHDAVKRSLTGCQEELVKS